MANRQVLQVFETYQKARTVFVQTVAELSTRPQNVDVLQSAGVLALLRPLLLDTVPTVQHTAALALGRLANCNDELAAAIVSSDILPQLVYSLAEQNRFYKKAAAFVLRTVAKHDPKLAKAVVDSGALEALVTCLEEFDPGVKEAASWALGYIARHNAELAQAVVDYTNEARGNSRMSGIMALGYIAAYSEKLALAVIKLKAITPLADALKNEPLDSIKAAAAWALGNIGRHTPEHAKHVADANVFPTLLSIVNGDGNDEVKKKASRALQNILQKCIHLPALESLLSEAPKETLQHIVAQFAKVLPNDAKQRKLFVTSGGLKKIQEIKADEGSALAESIDKINSAFPAEIVKYYTPGYSDALLNRLDAYEPAAATAQ